MLYMSFLVWEINISRTYWAGSHANFETLVTEFLQLLMLQRP